MTHDRLFTLGAAIVIGVLCGFGAVAFKLLIEGLHLLFWGDREMSIAALLKEPAWRVALIPALGGLAVGPIVYFVAREAKGHGVPEVMSAVAVGQGVIRARVAVTKAIASALTLASGGSAGREGPILQIGAAIGSAVGQLLKVSGRKMRTFVGCGAAAGLAATFNAPIAGALFAVEVILGEFGVAQFSPIVVSSVLATVIARHHFGGGPVFVVPEYSMGASMELASFLVLGLLCGIVSAGYIRSLYRFEDLFNGIRRAHPAVRPMLGGVAVGLMGLALPHLFGDGYETINLALRNQIPLGLLILLLGGKILATSLTLGSGGSGGVFAPSLFLGAMLGGALGQSVAVLLQQPGDQAGAYALVAMGGLVAGTTHAPISAILIIFEITYDYALILPLMLVCIVSAVLSQALNRESIYTTQLVRQGIDLVRGRSADLLKNFRVEASLVPEERTYRPDTPVRTLVEAMMHGEQSNFYIVGDAQRLLGVVAAADLRRVLLDREAMESVLLLEDLVHEESPVCTPQETLSAALLKFEPSGFTELPVVADRKQRTFLGVLRYTDVLALYHEEVLKRDTAEGLAQRVLSPDSARKVPLFRGFSLVEWAPPSFLWNATLAEAELPARYKVRVLLVKKRTAPGTGAEQVVPMVPGHDYRIHPDDTFLIYGLDEDVERVQKL